MKKRIPYSVSDYKKISSGEFYYVDKTRYIEDLENWEVPLFLRPKRFGKSLWCSTLAYYYDINYRDEFEQLFGNTYIGRHPTKSRNSYAVMSFSFASIDTAGSVEDIRRSFNKRCHRTYREFVRRYGSNQNMPLTLDDDATDALDCIFSFVREAGLPPIYIIIDEYDNFTNSILTSRGMDDYHSVTTGDSFLRVFYKAIKEAVGSGTVGRVFMTGVLPVTMDDMTSGFNIAKDISFLPDYLGMAGFTHPEVKSLVEQIIADYCLPAALKAVALDELNHNYDGYAMAPQAAETLYNSTICNNFLADMIAERTMPSSSFDPNLAIDRNWLKLMAQANDRVHETMMTTVCDGTVKVAASSLMKRFNAMSFRDSDAVLELLFYLGILTWNDATSLRVPNQNQLVLLMQYCNELQGWNRPDTALVCALEAFMDSRDVEVLFSAFWDSYIRLIPTAAFTHLGENFYRTSFFMLCKPNMPKGMDTDIEQNTHSGRYDIRFWGYGLPWWDSHTVLLEFKYRRGDQPLPSAPQPDDIGQIHAYAADQRLLHPEKDMLQYLVYIRGHEEWRLFPVA